MNRSSYKGCPEKTAFFYCRKLLICFPGQKHPNSKILTLIALSIYLLCSLFPSYGILHCIMVFPINL